MSNHSENEIQKTGFGTAGLVLGIIGLCTSFIPIVNNLSFVMGILAIIFGIIALTQKNNKGKVIAVIILGILSIVITINAQNATKKALDTASESLNKATGGSTEEVLANDADVTLGSFKVTSGDYGMTDTKLTVTVKNKTTETKSFTIHVEATSTDGTRIADDYVYANDLTAGQSQNFDIFTLVQSDKLNSMKNATFKIVEASAF